MRRFMTWLATAATLTFTLPLQADQNDPRLNALFTALKTAESPEVSQPIEQEIWQIWLISGVPSVDSDMIDGIHAMNAGDSRSAMAAFTRVIRAQPDLAEGWNRRATLNYLLGRHRESLDDIEKTLELEPRHFGAWSGLGLVYLALEQERDALKAFETAHAIHPNMPGVVLNIRELRRRLIGRSI